MKAIIADLDGTLYDSRGRKHYVEGSKPNFEKFYKAAILDYPNQWCAEIVRRFSIDHQIIYVSGRPETYEQDALTWLKKWELPCPPFANLYMRKAGDYRKDCIIKKEIYDAHIRERHNVVFVLDDRKQVADMWRAEGLVCLLCHEGNF